MASTRHLAAIMFTDIVGYTSSTQENEKRTLELLREQEEILRPLFAARGGREVKSTGDGFLVEFDSALHAVECAMEILHQLEERNRAPSVTPIQLRIGIHLGDVEERGGDIFGDAVNITSRVQPLAMPGGLCITGQVYDQVRNKLPNRFEKLPPANLKHVHLPIDVYRVTDPGEGASELGGRAPRTRLAVLPLANISPDPKDEYFADGLTEELISSLSKLKELRVIARTSVGQYKATAKPIGQIATELDVGSLLEGSVRKSGNRLRITLQLIDAGTQEHIWADSFDRTLDDVFAIQTEIAERTAGALRLQLIGDEQESIRRRPTSNLEAYNAYLRGLYTVRRELSGLAELQVSAPIRHFEEAIRLDPRFSLAYSALANWYIAVSGQALSPRDAFPPARQLVMRALELDPGSFDAHTARGNLALQDEHDWELAEVEFKKSISLNPSDVNARFWFSMLLILLQRYDEGEEQARIAIELDPLWETLRTTQTNILILRGDLPGAIRSAQEAVERSPSSVPAHLLLAALYARANRPEEALREIEPIEAGDDDRVASLKAWIMAALGRSESARAYIAKASPAKAYRNVGILAQIHATLGDNEMALNLLEEDYETGDRIFPFSYQSIGLDSIRSDPRFKALMKKYNLPTEPKKSTG